MTTYNTGNPLGSTDPRDLFDNAQNTDDAVNGDGKTWVDRFGRTRVSMKGVEEAVPDAIAARDITLLARDAAIAAAGPLYTTEAEGRAAVVNGESFNVQGSGSVAAYVYRRLSASSSELIAEFPSAQYVAESTPMMTDHMSSSPNLLNVTPRSGYSSTLVDGREIDVAFRNTNTSGVTLRIYPQAALSLLDALGKPLARGMIQAGETRRVVYYATPEPHFRLMERALKTGSMRIYPSRSALETAATSGATLPDDAVYVAGYSASGDGGACVMSAQSQVNRSSSGFGVVVGPEVGPRAFGVSLGSLVDGDPPFPLPMDRWKRESLRTRDDTMVAVPNTGLYFIRGADSERMHVIGFASSSDRVELDASTVPRVRQFSVVSRGSTGAKFVIDAGSGRYWNDANAGRYLVCPSGVSIRFAKDDLYRFYILSCYGGDVYSTNDFVRQVRTQSILAAGQSILAQAFGRGYGAGSFVTRYNELYSGASTNFINVASGGSGICERDITSSNYWVDMTTPNAPADGPLLTAAAAIIASRDGDLSQPQISAILWDQGQTSATSVDSPETANAAFTREMYVDASVYALNRLRAMIGSNVPVIFQMLGRAKQPQANIAGWQVIREAQRDVVSAISGAYLGPETWDYTYKDSLHPDDYGQYNMGIRLAEAVAAANGKTGLTAMAQISAVSYNSAGRYIDVTVSSGVKRFVNPEGFTIFDASGAKVTISRIHWSGSTTLRIFLPQDVTGGVLYYGYGIVQIADDRLIPRINVSESSVTLGYPIRPIKYTL